MKKIFIAIALTTLLGAGWLADLAGADDVTRLLTEIGSPAPFKFRMVELPEKLTVGYAVLCVDVNGDGKKDIVVVDTTRVIWFENPSWKRRTIIEGKTQPDNVCIAAHDIDGDGQLDFALGAGWNPGDTKAGGTLHWL